MSAGRVSKLAAPSAGKRSANNGGVRTSPKRPSVGQTSDGVASSSTSKCSSRVTSSSGRASHDYVALQYVTGQASSCSDVDGAVASQQQQQAILASHLQVRRTVP